MEQTIDVTVDFVRTEGLYRGAAKDLRKRLGKLSVGQNAVQLGKDLRSSSQLKRSSCVGVSDCRPAVR